MRSLIITAIFLISAFSAGAQPITEWVQRYNSPGNYGDYVNDMVVDGQGNVYLTGFSNGDFLTIKYLSSGTLRWVRTYDGPYHGSDEAISISLDKQKNIYVLGLSRNIYGKEVYAVVKYSNEGEQLWVREYINADSILAIPKGLAVDDSGNVYVTGYCSTMLSGAEFTTLKFNDVGAFQWVKFFGGSENTSESPSFIIADKDGNSYVTGIVYDTNNSRPLTTIKYDLSGNLKWVAKYIGENNGIGRGIKIDIDNFGNVFVAGEGKTGVNTKFEYVLLKYDKDGYYKWVRRYRCISGVNGNAYLKDMLLDKSNNIIITGLSDSNQNGWDFTTLKYNNNGDWLWVKRYKKAFNSSDDVNAIAVDRFNNVYVTGGTDNNTPWYQYLTVKYSQEGNYNWDTTYSNNNPFYYNHEAIKVKTDSVGNIYVTGNSEGIGTGMDIATIKYSCPSGIRSLSNEIPAEYKLFQNYPNPFNSETTIEFDIKDKGIFSMEVFDMLGRKIETLFTKQLNTGKYQYKFNANNFSSGIYFYRLEAGSFVKMRRMVLIK